MIADLSIRALTAADLSDWLALQAAADAAVRGQALFDRMSEPGPQGALIARAGRVPVGYVQYLFHRTCWAIGDACCLQALFVHPDWRGRGAGRALLRAAEALAREAGAAQVYWAFAASDAAARGFSLRLGLPTPFVEYEGGR